MSSQKKLYGLLSGGKWWPIWSVKATDRFSGPVEQWDWGGDVLLYPRGLGPAGCVGDCRPDDSRGREESLGVVEVLRSTAARWASVESQTTLAGLLSAALEPAPPNEEAAPGSISLAAGGRAAMWSGPWIL